MEGEADPRRGEASNRSESCIGQGITPGEEGPIVEREGKW